MHTELINIHDDIGYMKCGMLVNDLGISKSETVEGGHNFLLHGDKHPHVKITRIVKREMSRLVSVYCATTAAQYTKITWEILSCGIDAVF